MYFNLDKDVLVYPVYKGYVIYPKGGSSLILNDEVYRFLKTLPHKKNRNSEPPVFVNKLLNKGIITLNSEKSSNGANWKEYTVTDEIKSKYTLSDFSWFEYIPSRLEIDLTNKCNFKCIHCSRESGLGKKEELSTKELHSLIDQAAENGIISLTLMGGEPLCRPDIRQILQSIRGKFFHVSLGTNGWFVKKYIEELSNSINLVQVSLHAADAENHDNFVKKRGAFEKAISGIKMLKKNGVKVIISHSITPKNQDQYQQMFDLAKALDADNLRFVRMAWVGRAKGMEKLSWQDICKAEKQICHLSGKYDFEVEGGGLNINPHTNSKAYVFGCSAGRSLMCVDSIGNVIMCAGIDESVGNIRKEKLINLWHNEKYIKSRRQNENCHGCLAIERCSGLCRVGISDPYSNYIKPLGVKKCFADPNLKDF